MSAYNPSNCSNKAGGLPLVWRQPALSIVKGLMWVLETDLILCKSSVASAHTNLSLFFCHAEGQVQDYVLGKPSTTELRHQPLPGYLKQGFDHYIFTYLE